MLKYKTQICCFIIHVTEKKHNLKAPNGNQSLKQHFKRDELSQVSPITMTTSIFTIFLHHTLLAYIVFNA